MWECITTKPPCWREGSTQSWHDHIPRAGNIYDLLWCLSDPAWPAPNLTLLNPALAQTDWQGGLLTERTWRQALLERLRSLAWSRVRADVSPFLEPGFDPALLNLENLERVLS